MPVLYVFQATHIKNHREENLLETRKRCKFEYSLNIFLNFGVPGFGLKHKT